MHKSNWDDLRFVLAHAEQAEAAMLAAAEDLGDSHRQAAGHVCLTAVPFVINHLLLPGLPDLLQRYPAIELELMADADNLRLADRQADLALRLARPVEESRMLTRKICDLPCGLYRHRDAEPAQAERWIVYTEAMAHLPHAAWLNAQVRAGGEVPVRVNDMETALQLLGRGIGRSLLPCRIGDAVADLQRLPAECSSAARELWLVIHPDRRDLARVRAVVDWLQTCLA